MALHVDEVLRIADLARLELGEAEAESLVSQLGQIVDYVDQLAAFETDPEPATEDPGAEATDPAVGLTATPEAEDEAASGRMRESFAANAPREMQGYLVVPKVKRTPES